MARKFVLQARRIAGTVDFASDLNPEQLAVATAPGGPMLVIAGAGSGKTRALTYRLAWLVEQGVDPSRILLVTFTNRAAREMLHRVELLVQQRTQSLWGGTFHHIANRVLREHGRHIGVAADFTILDREDAGDLIRACIHDAGVPVGKRRFPQKNVMGKISSFVQNTLLPLEQVLTRYYPMFMTDVDGIRTVLDLYVKRKRERQLLDYDDLLAGWLVLLREFPAVSGELSERFLHILVDEYQDTNAIQGEIVDRLAAKHRNVCVVGDDSQAIYSFRGASFANILRFRERYPDEHEYRLETNYRSTPEILTLANASIGINQQRLPKELRAVRPSGLRPSIVPCRDHFVQSRFVGEYILYLLDQGRRLGDLAVLYRSHWHSLELQLELQRRNIPFQVRGGLRFFEQAHIKDVLCYLRVIQNPRDELAWMRVLPLLPRIGTGYARRIWAAIGNAPDPLEEAFRPETEALLPPGVAKFYREFALLMRGLRDLPSPPEMLDWVMKRFYDDYLVSHYDGASVRREDIKSLASFSSQYNSLEAFLADIALSGKFSGETVVNGPDEMEFVTLSTVHQAKGLEWPVVFIPWMADGRFPTDMAINTPEDLEEERRVFHVAVTRAKDELYLIVPQIWRHYRQEMILMKPSRFLTELPPALTEPLEIEEGLSHVTVGEPKPATDAEPPKKLPPPRKRLPKPRKASSPRRHGDTENSGAGNHG